MKSLNDPLEIIFVVLNFDPLEIIFVVLHFVVQFYVSNVDDEGVNIHDSKFRDTQVPTKITKIGTPRK